jgi:hypothetical protein
LIAKEPQEGANMFRNPGYFVADGNILGIKVEAGCGKVAREALPELAFYPHLRY